MKGSQIKFKQPEKIAVMFLEAIASLEDDCRRHAGHLCSLDELVSGPKATDNWNIGKLKFDPAKDRNYKYTLTLSGNGWRANANPRGPGLGGFFFDGGAFSPKSYYNPKGPASAQDTQLGEIGIDGDSFKTH